MNNDTRVKFNAYKQQIATLNGVGNAAEKFNVSPAVQQTLETKIQEKSSFLKQISVEGVKEQTGDKVGIGVDGLIASTTDTDAGDRETRDPTTLDKDGYFCSQTNFDTHMRYKTLDAWAGRPDFQTRVRDSIIQRSALDRICVGFNGTRRAATSNKAANPLGQDVNIGWLEKIRQFAPEQHVFEVASGSGVIKVGKKVVGADGFKNLDAVIFAATNDILAPWYQEDTRLVAITGRKLLADKYFPIVNQSQPNTEALAADMIISQKRIGNLPAVRVPFFPADAVLVIPLYLLSLYWQIGARRRAIIDNPKRDRIENYESSNDAYVIEDYQGAVLIENIRLEPEEE